MSETKDATEETAASAPVERACSEDLSGEIARTVEKRPGDQVRCTRVGGASYRCNWWAAEGTAGYDNPAMVGLLVTTHRVRRSRFLHVTKKLGALVITEIPAANASGAQAARRN